MCIYIHIYIYIDWALIIPYLIESLSFKNRPLYAAMGSARSWNRGRYLRRPDPEPAKPPARLDAERWSWHRFFAPARPPARPHARPSVWPPATRTPARPRFQHET